jgi:hypothetical protein
MDRDDIAHHIHPMSLLAAKPMATQIIAPKRLILVSVSHCQGVCWRSGHLPQDWIPRSALHCWQRGAELSPSMRHGPHSL